MKAQASPRSTARITGVVYLLFFLTAIPGEIFLRQAGISGIQLSASEQKPLFTRSVLQPRGIGYPGFRQPLSTRPFGRLGRQPVLERV